jgi:hypothetical protein
MSADAAASWSHTNRHDQQSTCEHCGGVVSHEKWCLTCDALVRYAYTAAQDPEKLTLRDRLILHALGVTWGLCGCEG